MATPTKVSVITLSAAAPPGGAAGARRAAERPTGVGELVLGGKYRIEEALGGGGMGVVMGAEHVALRQKVALKFLDPARGGCPQRFVREARAAARIGSEHVARVSDVGVLDSGVAYMVMERLHGEDVGAYVRRAGPRPIDEAVLYVVQACDAVAAAHAAGVIHRDLKPSNLFLARRPDGGCTLKVLDFGISKLARAEPGAEASLTLPGALLGSPRYMSPEQVRDTKRVDVRTDIWGLGLVLYELLAGVPMYEEGTFAALCLAIVQDPPTPLRSKRPDAPEALEAVLLRCAQKDPARRYGSALEFARALAPFGPPEAAQIVAQMARRCPATLDPTVSGVAPEAWLPPDLGDPSESAPVASSLAMRPATKPPRFTFWLAVLAAIVAFGAASGWRLRNAPSGARSPATPAPTGVGSSPSPAPPLVPIDDLPLEPTPAPHASPGPAESSQAWAIAPAPTLGRKARPAPRPSASADDFNHSAVRNRRLPRRRRGPDAANDVSSRPRGALARGCLLTRGVGPHLPGRPRTAGESARGLRPPRPPPASDRPPDLSLPPGRRRAQRQGAERPLEPLVAGGLPRVGVRRGLAPLARQQPRLVAGLLGP